MLNQTTNMTISNCSNLWISKICFVQGRKSKQKHVVFKGKAGGYDVYWWKNILI